MTYRNIENAEYVAECNSLKTLSVVNVVKVENGFKVLADIFTPKEAVIVSTFKNGKVY